MTSTYTTTNQIITSDDIIAAFEAHGDDCMIIDIDNLRKSKYADYGDIFIKNINGDLIKLRFWKLSGKGIMTASSIKEPAKRSYVQVRVGITHLSKIDGQDVETNNTKAMKILCEVFMRKMQEMRDNKIITDNKINSKLQPDGTKRPVYFINTTPITPMQTHALDKKTEELKELDNPYYWISIPVKRFYNENEQKRESVHYDNLYYLDDNKPDFNKPIMSFEYGPTFYNIDDFIHHPRTGKKIYKKLGDIDESGSEVYLDNTNIHKHLTKGSAMVGGIKFELVITGRQAKLEMSLYGSMHVRKGTYSYQEEQDDEFLDEFNDLYGNSNTPKRSVDGELDEPEDIDF